MVRPLQVSPVRGTSLQVQPSEADDMHMSDASDAEFVQLPGEAQRGGGSASAHLNGGGGGANWPTSPMSPALPPSFFDVDLRDPGAPPGPHHGHHASRLFEFVCARWTQLSSYFDSIPPPSPAVQSAVLCR